MTFRSFHPLSVVAAGIAASSALAHHSVYGVFDRNKPFSITGVVTEIEWVNPHIFVYVDATDEDGNVTAWRLETLPTAMMRKANLTKAMLMGDGEPVTATGIVAHTDPNMGWLHRITYSDGHFYQLANPEIDAGSSTFPEEE